MTAINVAGLDIGFSRTRPSSGVATLVNGRVQIGRYMAGTAACNPIIDAGPFRVIAIDGPIICRGDNPWVQRSVEGLFASGRFQRRCKPAASHVPGTGRLFREAACAAADRLATAARLLDATPVSFPLVRDGSAIVETFPNTFLGVCLNDRSYNEMPVPLRRGKKFDWLYDQWIEHRIVEQLLSSLPLPVGSEQVPQIFARTKNHDERAALVCMMAALFVAQGAFTAVGDSTGGWFFLPPLNVWQPWARDALEEGVQRRNWSGAALHVEEGVPEV